MGPDWSLLAPELLEAIVEKVTSLADYIRFRAVCHPWCSASSPRPHHLPIQIPWLMLPYKTQGNGGSTRLFYDLSTSKIHSLDLPETRGAILTSSPLDTTSCLVIVFTSSRFELAFCKIGDKCWTVIQFKAYFPGDLSDFTYSNGFLYTIDRHGSVTKYDLINPSKMIMGGGINPYNKYLVYGDGVDGDVLLLTSARRGRGNNAEKVVEWECDYRVFNFSIDEKLKWIEVNDVGKNVLFVGAACHALSLSSAKLQLPDWGANCLYYDTQGPQWKNQIDLVPWFCNTKLKLVRVNNWTVTDIIGDFGSFKFNEYWQMSFWLTPSLL
ncbi:hypothetical protein LUZ63_002501 [Rhynchospora breviuscula]|uniref:KIB1-4 beta-propeller domain-containing protein n=1 Tax=Rhynchospora breviuscula TaxID=2022672 RepID=A0A9Q0CYU8_9POAL|nr:hypothetical protein LUZ63_002501 [Rhynchospora breviuscula]